MHRQAIGSPGDIEALLVCLEIGFGLDEALEARESLRTR
jgi:hypothetical protein